MSQAQLKIAPNHRFPATAKVPFIDFKSRYEAQALIREAIDDQNLARQSFYILSATNFLENISVKKCPYGIRRQLGRGSSKSNIQEPYAGE